MLGVILAMLGVIERGKHEQMRERFLGRAPNVYEKLHDRHRKVLEVFSHHRFERILDVGCGDGNFSTFIGKVCRASEIYGLDISEKGIELARRNGVKAFQLDVDVSDFPFEDEFFDAVFAGEIIEHLFDPDHFLDEIHRVLKPKGVLVLTTPNLASLHNRIALLLGYQPFPMGVSLRFNVGRLLEPIEEPQSLDHVRVFTLRALKKLLELHAFKIIEIEGCPAQLPQRGLLRVLAFIDRLLALIPSLSYRVIVVAEKA